MKVDKMSISLDPDLGEEVRRAAHKSGKAVSTWLAEAAAEKIRSESLREFLDDWEKEHGAFTEEELARARKELALDRKSAR